MTTKQPTKKDYENFLKELGAPNQDLKSHGGRCPDNAHYGKWLRRNDPIAFNLGYSEFCAGFKYNGLD